MSTSDGQIDEDQFYAEEVGVEEQNRQFARLNPTVQELHRSWRNEALAPGLLPFKGDVILDLHTAISKQQAAINEVRQQQKESRSSADMVPTINLFQMEIDRIKYGLVRYLRTRLRKIEKVISLIAARADLQALLSPKELTYAMKLHDLARTYISDAVMTDANLKEVAGVEEPEESRRLSSFTGLRGPAFVFVHVLQDIDPIRVGDDVLELSAGDTCLVPYDVISTFLVEGRLELL